MGERARMVIAWIDGIEARAPFFIEHFDEILADSRLAPGQIILIAPPPLLRLDLDVFADA